MCTICILVNTLQGKEIRTYKQRSRVRVLSEIMRPMNDTSPPGVINSLVAAVGAWTGCQ